MWTLLLIVVIGSFSTDIKFVQIPMMDRFSCMEAANSFKNNSKGISIQCISSNTGEVITIVDKDGKQGKDQSKLSTNEICEKACVMTSPYTPSGDK